MKNNGAIPTHRPLTGVTHAGMPLEHPRAPQHEFLVASFFARTAPAAEIRLAPRQHDARTRSLRRKFLTGDFP